MYESPPRCTFPVGFQSEFYLISFWFFFSDKQEHPLHRRPALSGIAASRFASGPGRRGLNHRNDFLLLLCCSCRIQTLAHKVRRFSLGNNVHRPKVLHQIRPLSTQGCFSPPQPAKVPEGRKHSDIMKSTLEDIKYLTALGTFQHRQVRCTEMQSFLLLKMIVHYILPVSKHFVCQSMPVSFFSFFFIGIRTGNIPTWIHFAKSAVWPPVWFLCFDHITQRSDILILSSLWKKAGVRPGSRLLSHVNVMYKKKKKALPWTEFLLKNRNGTACAWRVFNLASSSSDWVDFILGGWQTHRGLLLLGSDGLNFNLISFPLAFD